MRLSQTTKVEHDLFGGFIGKVFLNFVCFFGGEVGAICCSGIVELFGASLLPKSFNKSTKSDQRCPRGDQNRSEGVRP